MRKITPDEARRTIEEIAFSTIPFGTSRHGKVSPEERELLIKYIYKDIPKNEWPDYL